MRILECAQCERENHNLKINHPQSVNLLQQLRRMCAALGREPHFEEDLFSIFEAPFTRNVQRR
eukprot:1787304-Pyramimonas_sp.AAC.1